MEHFGDLKLKFKTNYIVQISVEGGVLADFQWQNGISVAKVVHNHLSDPASMAPFINTSSTTS